MRQDVGAFATVLLVLAVSACGSTSANSGSGGAGDANNGDGGAGADSSGAGADSSAAGGSIGLGCGNFSVSVAVDGVIGTACGQANLLHGIVFACSAVGSIGTSSFSVSMGVPATVGTFAHPVPAEQLSAAEQLANGLAKVTLSDSAGVLYQFDEQHGQGTMTVESASDQSAAGNFDFSDSGKRIVGSVIVRCVSRRCAPWRDEA
jgi:hypothetical protein